MSLPSNAVVPKFTHDCNRCHFVGRLDGKDGYICQSHSASVVLRASDAPEDYISAEIALLDAWEQGQGTKTPTYYTLNTVRRMGDAPNNPQHS